MASLEDSIIRQFPPEVLGIIVEYLTDKDLLDVLKRHGRTKLYKTFLDIRLKYLFSILKKLLITQEELYSENKEASVLKYKRVKIDKVIDFIKIYFPDVTFSPDLLSEFLATNPNAVLNSSVFLLCGAVLEVKSKSGRTLLSNVACLGYEAMVTFLIDAKANVNGCNDDGGTPLLSTIGCGKKDVVDILIQNKANVDQANNKKLTPIHEAMRYGRLSVIKSIIAAKANLNVQDDQGWTPFHSAIMQLRHRDEYPPITEGITKGIQLLVDAKADVHLKDNKGRTPLQFLRFCFGCKEVKDVLERAENDTPKVG